MFEQCKDPLQLAYSLSTVTFVQSTFMHTLAGGPTYLLLAFLDAPRERRPQVLLLGLELSVSFP